MVLIRKPGNKIQGVLFDAGEPEILEEPLDSWYLSQGFFKIAGVDEAGRGALAGPVSAAAVILGDTPISGLDDSKRLTPVRREELYEEILTHAAGVGVALVGSGEIDRINILQAALEAMRLAVEMLPGSPDIILVDGNQLPAWNRPSVAVVRGDRKSLSIMAASIVAKVTRDRYMIRVAGEFDGWGFEKHKGYGAKAHLEAIDRQGLAPIHRLSFSPCKEIAEVLQHEDKTVKMGGRGMGSAL